MIIHSTIIWEFLTGVQNISHGVDYSRWSNRFVKANSVSDLIILVGEDSFYSNKLPMVSISGYINRWVPQSNAASSSSIRIDNLPGGSKMFELVVKFSYGMKINLRAANICPLCRAANFLEMSDNLEPGNLIPTTEAFMIYLILSQWQGTLRILKTCESISLWARDLQISRVRRIHCQESLHKEKVKWFGWW